MRLRSRRGGGTRGRRLLLDGGWGGVDRGEGEGECEVGVFGMDCIGLDWWDGDSWSGFFVGMYGS